MLAQDRLLRWIEIIPRNGQETRTAWDGLIFPALPLRPTDKILNALNGQPVYRPWSDLRGAWIVPRDDALAVLEWANPKAAQWLRNNVHSAVRGFVLPAHRARLARPS